MGQIVLLNKKGLTLVEVLIALVVLLFVSLAMLQTALVSIDSNMRNVLRDEAVSIAEMEMNEARNSAFDSLTGTLTGTVQRNIRNISNFTFNITRTITDLTTDNKQVDISVAWTWKGNPYTHTIISIVRRQ